MTEPSFLKRDAELPSGGGFEGSIRLLATTDLHGHLRAYDYTSDRAQPGTGLSGIATLIRQARAEAQQTGQATVLLDNGDTLQGTPLASLLAKAPVTPGNAIVACLNALAYDAVGVGNHDLDHGQTYLADVARALEMPMICSNIKGALNDAVQTSALISCAIPDGKGSTKRLKLGVLSLLPPLTGVWNRHVLGADTEIAGAVDCLNAKIPDLRAQGADLVVVLAHMGVGHMQSAPNAEEVALALVDVEGIDALITGHTHRRLPGPDYQGRVGVDANAGRLRGVPAVMAGHGGSDLAVLDLRVTEEDGRWRVVDHHAELRRNTPETPLDDHIMALSAAAHEATRTALSRPVARVKKPLHNFFALLGPTGPGRLLARTKARIVRDALRGSRYADLPLLASAAAHTSGGRAGPDHYLHIPAGQMLQRHIAGLDPYSNQVLARLITGAELQRWLEHSALIFAQIARDQPDQSLIDPTIPGFHFDTIFGVQYDIDPTMPSGPGSGRIRNLRWQGTPVAADQEMVIATNQFRAAGGGGFLATPRERILMRKPALTAEDFSREVAETGHDVWPAEPAWRFAPDLGLHATILTSPVAAQYLDDIAHLSPEILDITCEGFARLRVHL